MAKFYFESFTAAAAFAHRHGLPSCSIHRFGKRCEIHLPGDIARKVRLEI